ncbi:uncharacterized protein LOC127811882 isoform X2 [Diospyros lotus]|uniref:uncharacterized protein LOC127811882 isoform X2 n=1 Tax=Diospyros lotus TaxID=55363 RepID=UPI00224CAC5D|nr:uncharacterized protein LOC127811882 isoform X2 [Diospyros lotus]
MKSGGGEEFEVGFFGNQGFGEVEKSSPEEVRTSVSPVLEDWNTGLAISCVRFDVNDSHCFLRSSLERHFNEPFVGSIQHGALRIMEECPNFRNADFTNKRQCVFEGLNKMVANDEGNGCSLKIKVIDETAVIETISGNRFRIGNEEEDHVGFGKYSERIDEKNITKQETHARKKKRPRRRGKGAKNMSRSTNPVEQSPNHTVESHISRQEKSKDTKRAYSREELMAMRSVNLEEQRKKWIQAYCGLEPTVAREYDGLVGCNRQKHIQVNFDPRKQCSYKDFKAPGLLGICPFSPQQNGFTSSCSRVW